MSSLPGPFDIGVDELRARRGVKWTRFGAEVIPAFVAEMDARAAPEVQEAITAGVERQMYGYLSPELGADLGAATAAWYADEFGWALDPELVRPIADVLAALELVLDRFTAPGSAVVVPTPAYMPFLVTPGLRGRPLIELPMTSSDGRYLPDLEALDAALAGGAGCVVLCNPHNPTGAVYTAAELGEFAAVVERRDAVVFSDEIHAAIRYGRGAHVPYASVSEAAARHTITATSASKAWNLPGLKCAQLLFSNPEHFATYCSTPHHSEIGPATLGVLATIAAYQQGRPWLASVLEFLDESRHVLADLLAEHLPGARYRPPDGTYLAWIDCRDAGLEGFVEEPGALAARFLERSQVALTDGSACGATGFVRLNFATPRPVLTELVTRMGRAVAST